MRRPSLSWWLALALLGAALFPVAIGTLQLRNQRDALLDQVGRMQILTASTAAADIASLVDAVRTAAETAALQPALADPLSAAAREQLVALLQAEPRIFAAAVFDGGGAELVKAQRSEERAELAAVLARPPGAEAEIVPGERRRWLRRTGPLGGDGRRLVVVADLDEAAAAFERTAIVGEAQAVLVGGDGTLLLGSDAALAELPPSIVAQAVSGKITAGAGRYRGGDEEEVVAAYHPVAGTPWFVVSRQPRAAADVARRRIRQGTLWASGGALALAALLSGLVYLLLVRPMRRLAAAQAAMVGLEDQPTGGSELDRLESTFAQLLRFEQDRDDMGQVFLGRYQVLGRLGRGGAGTVFRGYDPVLKREVALKTVSLPADAVKADDLVSRLQIEAVHAAQLNHPNIVTVHDFEQRGDTAYIAMERVDGVSLAQYLARRGALEIDETLAVARAIAAALAAAHGESLVHGDLKPSNVMLARDGAIKVADFGTSRLMRRTVESDDRLMGTPGYVAPEVLGGRGGTQASDLFSCGVVIYEMLAGRGPFAHENLSEVLRLTRRADPTPIDELRAAVPVEVSRLVGGLLARDPDRRPGPAAQLADYLGALVAARGFEWRPDPLVMEWYLEQRPATTTDLLTRYLPTR
ncbi:MAG: serine/threonine protein kinase [Acidobacteriota bacterium]|nr:serine/threonine protein kinase [Acidobacteriota bacterium]MDH3523624.1 serine/threonine protein kinase [Acidobacteriota bacterium]